MEEKKEDRRNLPVVRPRGICVQEKDRIRLSLDMPGVQKNDLDIQVENYVLRVRGIRAQEVGNGKFLLRERPYGAFETAYTLDDTVDTGKIDADLSSGVLTLTIDLKEAVKPKKITVKAG